MEENFYELYEQYLDEESIQEKINSEYKEDLDDKRKSINKSPFTKEDTITINEFVNNYLGISSDATKLYHSGLKDLQSPYVVGVSNEFANKNQKLVKNGFLLLVMDARNNRGTYINPYHLKLLLTKEENEKEYKCIQKQRISDLAKLEEYLQKYQELKIRVETNEHFYKYLEQVRKTKKLEELKKYEDESRGIKK